MMMLWFPYFFRVWMLDVLLDQQACYKQYVDYTFTKRFGMHRFLAKIIAYPLSFFISTLLRSGKGIPVHRGSRSIIQTLRQTVTALEKGESVAIFPDIEYSDPSAQTKSMYEGFLYLEKYYYEATGKHICFIPLYVSKKRRLIVAEQKIYFRKEENF